MSLPSDPPQSLLRFPADVRAAYQTFRNTRDPAALRVVVFAAVSDFMPRGSVHAKVEPLHAEQRLIDDLGFDSLAVAETVFFFEDIFKVAIKNEELMALRTVGELCDFIARRMHEQTSAA